MRDAFEKSRRVPCPAGSGSAVDAPGVLGFCKISECEWMFQCFGAENPSQHVSLNPCNILKLYIWKRPAEQTDGV